MLKLALIAFLLIVLSVAAAEVSAKESCQREGSQHRIDRCRSFMKHGGRSQLLMSASNDDVEDDDHEESAPQECCMQLRQVRRDCRCEVIRDMMQEMKEEEGFGMGRECSGRCGEMMMRGRYLPAMCNVEPQTCRMS